MKDYTGLKFNLLTAIKFAFVKEGKRWWLFLCDCGKKKVLRTTSVVCGDVKSCGCTKYRKGLDNPKLIDISGKKFGMLTALKFYSPSKYGSKWLFECDCGNTIVRYASDVKKKHKHSCGCVSKNPGKKDSGFRRLFNDYSSSAKLRNYSFSLNKKEFRTLIERNCYYCDVPPYPRYKKQTAHAILANGIDRKDNSKGYSKSNCVPCCKICNRAKSSLSEEEFLNWIKMAYFTSKQRNK